MHTRARLGAVAWVVVLAVAAGACGGDDEDGASPTTTNTRFPRPAEVDNRPIREGEEACGLLTRSEIESVAGVSVNPGEGVSTKTGSSSCAYRLRNNTAQSVGVIIQKPGTSLFEGTSQQLGGAAAPLPGVGDRAFVAKDTVYALKADQLLIVSVATNQPEAARREAAIQLARSAIDEV